MDHAAAHRDQVLTSADSASEVGGERAERSTTASIPTQASMTTEAAIKGAPAGPSKGAAATALSAVSRSLAWVLVLPIWLYQRLLSPLWPGTCKFHPSCSHYATDALLTHGPLKGLLLTMRRLGRCHPWQLGGIDPVPARGRWTPDVDLMGRPITDGEDATEERTRVHH